MSWFQRFKDEMEHQKVPDQFPYERAGAKLAPPEVDAITYELETVRVFTERLLGLPAHARPRVLRYVTELVAEAP